MLRYNQSEAYADQVLAIARSYRSGYAVVPDGALSEAQGTGQPFLPTGPASGSTPGSGTGLSGTGSGTGTSGSGSGGSGPGGGATPAPSTTAGGGGLGDAVDGVVGGIVGGVSGQTPSSTSTPSTSTSTNAPKPSPSSTTSSPLPLEVLPKDGRCPTGDDPVVKLGVTVLCVRR